MPHLGHAEAVDADQLVIPDPRGVGRQCDRSCRTKWGTDGSSGVIVMLRDLVLHKGYANSALLSAAVQSSAVRGDAEIAQLLHHILVANRFWALSVVGEEFRADEELRSPRQLASLVDGFRGVQTLEETWLAQATGADVARQVAGPMVPGGRCTVAQAMMQACLHSLGHRAQCASLLRRHGVIPPTTDFIVWLVERPAARWP